jgi:hypothetical protein
MMVGHYHSTMWSSSVSLSLYLCQRYDSTINTIKTGKKNNYMFESLNELKLQKRIVFCSTKLIVLRRIFFQILRLENNSTENSSTERSSSSKDKENYLMKKKIEERFTRRWKRRIIRYTKTYDGKKNFVKENCRKTLWQRSLMKLNESHELHIDSLLIKSLNCILWVDQLTYTKILNEYFWTFF